MFNQRNRKFFKRLLSRVSLSSALDILFLVEDVVEDDGKLSLQTCLKNKSSDDSESSDESKVDASKSWKF